MMIMMMMMTKSAGKGKGYLKMGFATTYCVPKCKDDFDTELNASGFVFDIYKSRSTILFPDWAGIPWQVKIQARLFVTT
jgi:hypothetical protein